MKNKIKILAVVSSLLSLTACGGGSAPTIPYQQNVFETQCSVTDTIESNGIRIGAGRNHAGAVCSLTYRGKEYIDSNDHGRDLQTALSFFGRGEGFNPTEAGGSHRQDNPSQLLGISTIGNVLATTSKMAYWDTVGGKEMSDFVHHKRISIGHMGMPNVIVWDVQIDVPTDQVYWQAVMEVLTAYGTTDLDKFLVLNADNSLSLLNVLPDSFEEQSKPIIMATQGDAHAIGLISNGLPQDEYPTVGYGGFYLNGSVPKINVAYRHTVVSGSRNYRVYVVVGTLSEVRDSMSRI